MSHNRASFVFHFRVLFSVNNGVRIHIFFSLLSKIHDMNDVEKNIRSTLMSRYLTCSREKFQIPLMLTKCIDFGEYSEIVCLLE